MKLKSFNTLQEFIDSILDDVKEGNDIYICNLSSDGILFAKAENDDYLCNEFIDLDWLAKYLVMSIDDRYDYIVMIKYEYNETYKDVIKYIFAVQGC